MSLLDYAFNVEHLSLDDKFLLTSGDGNPNDTLVGAPVGSIYLSSNGVTYIKTGINNDQWAPIALYGLPAGGTTNQVLIKGSDADYDAYFGTITADMAPYAKQLVAFVKNDTQSIIQKGTPVYQTGNAGSSWTILVRPADAADSLKMPAIGVLAQDLAPQATGDMIVLGEIRDVDTSAFAEGDLIYVAPGGGYTNVKPSDVNHAVQFLGIVTKIHATNGGGYVTGTGAVDLIRSDGTGGFEGWDGTYWTPITGNFEVKVNDLDVIPGHLETKLASNTLTLSPINSNSQLGINLATTGVTPGTYTILVVDEYGRITSGSYMTALDITTSLGYVPVNKAGDSMTGPLSIPGSMPTLTTKTGLLTDNVYGWHDLKGEIIPHTYGLYQARRIPFFEDITAWAHPCESGGDVTYHITHDYAPGTDLFIHIHHGHNGTDIAGTFNVHLHVSYAKRGPQSAINTQWTSTKIVPVVINNLSITNQPQYDHVVTEVPLSIVGGSPTLLNTNDIEADGVIMLNYHVEEIPSITGSQSENLPFIFYIDIHYQTTNVGTVSKDPTFYS